MKSIVFIALFAIAICYSQNEYSVSEMNPYGLANPEAPSQIKDFQGLIGKCNCKSVTRNPDQSWAEPINMTWEWKYIMNGMAVQDETIKEDGKHSGSIRQFIPDSSKWYVHYYSSTGSTTTLPTWEGNKTSNGNIVLYRNQKAPNGIDGFYRLTFYDITKIGYNWVGEWVDKTEKITFPTWRIECKRPKKSISDLDIIRKNTAKFSQSYMDSDINSLVNLYHKNGMIMPNNRMIIKGKNELENYWKTPKGSRILHHKVFPTEIHIDNNTAYDYGYYEGKTLTSNNKEIPWKGKYVIVWKKVDNDWKIYLDIWNSIPN